MYSHDDDDDEDKTKGGEQKTDTFVSKLFKNRLVMVNGTVDQEMAEKVIGQLLVLDSESNDPIKVVITSPGGHVDSGYAILDVMRFVKSPVITLGAGWVASIAVPIFLAGNPGKRYSLQNTRFLLHQPSGGAGGVAADIRIEAQEILKIRKRLNQMIADETGQPVDKVTKDSDRNFWMTSGEALEYGIVSQIISKFDQAV